MATTHSETQVAPGLLIAMPQLEDPNFRRTVILMIDHQDSGSFGLVLNRPASIPVGALVQGFDVEWKGDPGAVVCFGGPVMVETGWILHSPAKGEAPPGTLRLTSDIALSTSSETLKQFAATPPARIRFLMGYAGWGPGQLTEELIHGSWLHAEATAKLVFETEPKKVWHAALASIGVDPMAVMPTSGVN